MTQAQVQAARRRAKQDPRYARQRAGAGRQAQKTAQERAQAKAQKKAK